MLQHWPAFGQLLKKPVLSLFKMTKQAAWAFGSQKERQSDDADSKLAGRVSHWVDTAAIFEPRDCCTSFTDTPPTNFSRSTSRTWRMVVLSAGIRSLLRKDEGADLSRPAEAPELRRRVIDIPRLHQQWFDPLGRLAFWNT
jgi:hypothetical protein